MVQLSIIIMDLTTRRSLDFLYYVIFPGILPRFRKTVDNETMRGQESYGSLYVLSSVFLLACQLAAYLWHISGILSLSAGALLHLVAIIHIALTVLKYKGFLYTA